MMLEVLRFPLDSNDAVNSLETMERKIKEFERHACIDIPEFFKVGIVIRQTDEGPIRTHLIMNARRLTTLQDVKAEVTNVKQAQSVVMSKTGDAMDADSFSEGSPKGASKGSGKGKNPEVTCWIFEKKGHQASECHKRHNKGGGKGKSKGPKKRDGKGAGKGKEGFEGKCFKCGKSGHMSKDCRSKEMSAFRGRRRGALVRDWMF